MTPAQLREAEMFEMLGRNEAFKTWLHKQLATNVDILTHNSDVVILHRAQGCSQLIQKMLSLSNKK